MPPRPARIQEAITNVFLFLGGVSLIACGLGAVWLSGCEDREVHLEARRRTAISQISSFQQAIEQYQKDHGQPPTAKQGLAALLTQPRAKPGHRYLDDVTVIPKDPWGNDYVYRCPRPDRAPYEIVSFGADGKPGGTGWGTDISSANLSPERR